MRDIATATLSGNLTRDVELRQLPSGADVARLRVATTTRRRTGEEWVDKTNYFTVEVFGAQARACAQHLAKGSRVLVDAEPDWREWKDQQNNKREAVTFKARQVLFEGTGRDPIANGNGASEPTPATVPAPVANTQPAAAQGAGGRSVRHRHLRRAALLMAGRSQRVDGDRRKRRRTRLHNTRPRNVGLGLKVAAVQKLHLTTVDDRSLCGLLPVDELDVYQDEAGLRTWNDGRLEQRPMRDHAHRQNASASANGHTDPRTGGKHVVHRDASNSELDGQVLATLRTPTLSGISAVMNPKQISHHIGHFIIRSGWGQSPQAVTASLRRLAEHGLVQRAGRSRTCWTITSKPRDAD